MRAKRTFKIKITWEQKSTNSYRVFFPQRRTLYRGFAVEEEKR